jgi:four helix bundle protein
MELERVGFQKLKAWQMAYALALDAYKMTMQFPKSEIYGITSQFRRAAISISANIAEGYERNHRKEYLQYLYIAKGSLGEFETYVLFARDLGYMDRDDFEILDEKRKATSSILRGLIKSLS